MNKKLSVTWLFVICLIVSCLFSNVDARKFASAARRSSKTNTGRVTNGGRIQKNPNAETANKYAAPDHTRLSYPGQTAPKVQTQQQHAVPQKPSAPVQDNHQMTGGAAKPIGWNVQQQPAGGGQIQKQAAPNTNAAPYPQQNVHNAPPAYSPHAQGAAPPPYSQHGNANPHYNDAPPAYSPHGVAPAYPGKNTH